MPPDRPTKERATALAVCLGAMTCGFVVGSLAIAASPWQVPGYALVALAVGFPLGVLEVLAIRRFGARRLKELLLLDGHPFPFASVGLAGAIIVFGAR